MLILDASGSMWGEIDGQAKIATARGVIQNLLSDWDQSIELGLTAYGHRSKGACDDIEMLQPVGPVDAGAIMKAVNEIIPKGKTPLTEAVRQAAEKLKYTEERATVILVSDGIETCDSDPCAAAKTLSEAGVDFKVHVVGFDLKQDEQDALRCLAENTGGEFLVAQNATGLHDALKTTVTKVKQEAVQVAAADTVQVVKKKASKELSDPTPLAVGEIVKGRLGNRKFDHYWKIDAQPGKYYVVLDSERADDKHSNIRTDVTALASDGKKIDKLIGLNEIDYRTRGASLITISNEAEIILKVSNKSSIVDYMLGVFPADAKVPSPYFVRAPAIKPLGVGEKVTVGLSLPPGPSSESWHSVTLEPRDYQFTVTFERLDGKKSNVRGELEMFGTLGERLGRKDKVCSVNEIGLTGTCAAKLSLAEDADILLRLSPKNDVEYSAKLLIQEVE